MEESILSDSLLEGHPLECSICLDRMTDISFLYTEQDEYGNICLHYFCSGCIEPMVARAKENNKKPRCPSCRRVILSVQKSRFANNLLAEVEKEREQRKKLASQKEEIIGELAKAVEEKMRLEEKN